MDAAKVGAGGETVVESDDAAWRREVQAIAAHFDGLDDPRSEINLRHPLASVLTIVVMAVLAGADGPTAIARWAKIKSHFLRDLLDLPHGVPAKDVFRNVLCRLKPAAFQACFATWLDNLRARAASGDDVMHRLLNVDGKTSRRSHDRSKGLGPLHSVSVWAADERMTLAQVACDEKSNEITAIPEVLKLVPPEGAVVTIDAIDAMGTQTAIAAQIVDGKGDYVLSLKGNQETIHRAVAKHMDGAFQVDYAVEGARTHATQEKGHGRKETRMYVQMPVPADLPGAARWKGLRSIGAAMLVCERDGRDTCETRYFLSSLPVDINLFARAVRGHWGIENTCHWSLDFTFREDQSRVRDRRSRENMAWLNRFALSLLQQHPGRQSLVMKRRSCGWDERFLLEVLAGKTGW